jgi:diguanylate cyclase
MMVNSPLNRKLQAAFAIPMLALLLMGAASYRCMLVLDESNRWVRHTHDVLDNLNDLQSSMESASRSYRDFVLTGEESYIPSYHVEVSIAMRDEAAVRGLTLDNPRQQNQLPRLESLLAEKLRIADEVIRLRRAKGFEVATEAVRSGTGLQTMDKLQVTLTEMKGEEMRLLAVRMADAKRRALQTKFITVIGMLLALVMSAGAGWSVRRESSARDLAQEAQREGEALLVEKVEELNRTNSELVKSAHAAHVMTQQMNHSAEHDALTGLPNRLLLNDRVGQAIAFAQRHGHQVAVLFLDLDGFKHINDSLGHPIGDKLLQSLAKRLVGCVGAADTVSRQGGDEFVVLLPEILQLEDSATMSRKLLQAVTKPNSIEQHDLHITASIGVSIYPDDGRDAETLIKNADTAMYQAKENGRQSYQFFRPSMTIRAVDRQLIEEHLRRALERQEFALHYQPITNLRTGAVVGAEALLRWTHPTRGLVLPGQFIPIAEDCGLILPIGAWVLREACAQAQAWADAGLPRMTIAVNVSAMQLMHESFVPGLFSILDESGLDPKYLELELTESALMKRADLAASILSTLRAIGIRVAVDDFGTGYSSLSYLRRFPLDALKIDQSFVRQITTHPDETIIVRAIISLGRSLNLRVIAEGVETQAQLDFLKAHQCDEAQGHYFGWPVPPQQLVKLLLEADLSQAAPAGTP